MLPIGHGKTKRKAKQKEKRMKKIKQGVNVPFNLQNSPVKYRGFSNKYCYQINIHNLIYKGASFQNVKFQSSIITHCNYCNANLIGVDFCHTNLKESKFKNARLNNVVFFNCNLKNCDFNGATFNNVTFIATNISIANNLLLNETCLVLKSCPVIDMSERLYNNILALASYEKLFKPHILNVNKTKINMWMLHLLLLKTNEDDLSRSLYALSKRRNKQNFYTLYSYRKFVDSYLQK